jgi:hypothetical protein
MMIDPSVDKQKKRNTCKVHTALAKSDHTYLTIVEDTIGLPLLLGPRMF